jgi:hypothetical protein
MCENVDCKGESKKLFKVKLTEDFNNDECIWCEGCLITDFDMVEEYTPLGNEELEDLINEIQENLADIRDVDSYSFLKKEQVKKLAEETLELFDKLLNKLKINEK